MQAIPASTSPRRLSAAGDTWNECPDPRSILKIDTEGCEVPILQDLFQYNVPIDMIYVEYHCERDRILIDGILSDKFMLSYSRANNIHRGRCFYVSRTLSAMYPGMEDLKI